MAVSIEQLVDQIAERGLLARDDVQALLNALPAGERPQDAGQLVQLLLDRNKLTAYQAEQISAGESSSLVLGNYVILDKLGQGGMGKVFKAQHRRMDRIVALKVLAPRFTEEPEALARFQREVKAAAKLEHPNIVIAYDADESGGTHFLVMQYVDGTDLARLVRQHGVFPLNKALSCILQAARGLQYAHAHGVVHRDIKPSNLILTVDQAVDLSDGEGRPTVKILDMGLARLESTGTDPDLDQITGTGQVLGTVEYMAPEQALATRQADARADIYSLGMTLWYLLTGRPCYDGENSLQKLMAHQKAEIPSLRMACSQVSPELDAVFTRMVAKSPESRYQSMSEVIAALRAACPQVSDSDAELDNLANKEPESPKRDRQQRERRIVPGGGGARNAGRLRSESTEAVGGIPMETPDLAERARPFPAQLDAANEHQRAGTHARSRIGLWCAAAAALCLLLAAGALVLKSGQRQTPIPVPKSKTGTEPPAAEIAGDLQQWHPTP